MAKATVLCFLLLFLILGQPETAYAQPASQQSLFSLSRPSAALQIEGQAPAAARRAVQINQAAVATLQEAQRLAIPLPDGQIVPGRVAKRLHGLRDIDEKQVISLDNAAGSVELVKRNGILTEMLIFEPRRSKAYRVELDGSGSGTLIEEDLNKYQCVYFPHGNQEQAGAEGSPEIQGAIPDLATLQTLQSRPGSTKVLYINYWGGTISGTAWNDQFNSGNPIVYTPYDRDGNYADFSDSERYLMWLGWREAAEDYAPFDINVTTDQSVYDATPKFNRVQLIATDTNYFYPGAGGVAYVGVFGSNSDYYTTAWVWNSSSTSLGMTISHESGHQIGLSHDGASGTNYYGGHGDWGPVMGAPFGKKYVQWSQGEYPGANQFQDDLVIIQNELGTVSDDAGDSLAQAYPLTLSVDGLEGMVTPDGLGEDLDYYEFVLPAPATVSVEIIPLLGDEGEIRGSNLSIAAELLDQVGTPLAQASPVLDPVNNKLSFNGFLDAGTYYLSVDAVSPDTDWSSGFGEYAHGGLYRVSLSTSISPTTTTIPASTTTTTTTSIATTTTITSPVTSTTTTVPTTTSIATTTTTTTAQPSTTTTSTSSTTTTTLGPVVTVDSATLLISTDLGEDVYFNGVWLGRSTSWIDGTTYALDLQPGKNVIAVRGVGDDDKSGVLAQFLAGDQQFVSDSGWKVSTTEESGWAETGFDDSSWSPATEHGHKIHRMSKVRGFGKDFEKTGAQWIWSPDNYNDQEIFLRFTIYVILPPLTLYEGDLPDGIVGQAYSRFLAASGGRSPYSWELVTGSLPEGLDLNPGTGEVYGIPTLAESTTFSVQVTDLLGDTVTESYTLAVTPEPLPTATLVISTDAGEDVYFNGAWLGQSMNWRDGSTYTLTLEYGENVIAVRAVGDDEKSGMLAYAAVGDQEFISDSSWKVSTVEEAGWTEKGFDDSSWAQASEHGHKIHSISKVQDFPVDSKSSPVQWIWSADNYNDSVVFLRKTFFIGP